MVTDFDADKLWGKTPLYHGDLLPGPSGYDAMGPWEKRLGNVWWRAAPVTWQEAVESKIRRAREALLGDEQRPW